jgi:hypothetical protein
MINPLYTMIYVDFSLLPSMSAYADMLFLFL